MDVDQILEDLTVSNLGFWTLQPRKINYWAECVRKLKPSSYGTEKQAKNPPLLSQLFNRQLPTANYLPTVNYQPPATQTPIAGRSNTALTLSPQHQTRCSDGV